MELETVWNAALTASIAVAGWLLKGWADEIKRLQILLNRTREDIAREYVTKAEVHLNLNSVITRLEALDAKIDRLMERVGK